MDARRLVYRQMLCLVILAATATSAFAASARTQNFIVSAATQELANEIASAAERYRRDLAIEWLGKELPNWEQPCPITAQVDPRHGAGGATSFIFGGGRPHSWTMNIQGSRERVLDSVLPHEVTHTIFATHFCRPLPRWADEGACTTVEHVSERKKQEKLLYEFLTTNRGIPFNRMFAMKEYPNDILPLYSQGYSLARFLIALGGKPKFVNYVGEGMDSNNWTAATKKHYGFHSLSDLQLTWIEWVRQGTPTLSSSDDVLYVSTDPARNGRTLAELSGAPRTAIASAERSASTDASVMNVSVPASPAKNLVASADEPQPARTLLPKYSANNEAVKRPPANRLPDADDSAAKSSGDGWYARRREEAQGRTRSGERVAAQPRTALSNRPTDEDFSSSSRPLPPDQVRQRVLEYSREENTLMPSDR
jgi:hypothetical protein